MERLLAVLFTGAALVVRSVLVLNRIGKGPPSTEVSGWGHGTLAECNVAIRVNIEGRGNRYIVNIQTTDSRLLAFDQDVVYDAIVRFEKYAEWWPAKFGACLQRGCKEGVGKQIVFSPLPCVKAGWEITSLRPHEEVQIAYFKGFHSGTGVWRFVPREGGTLVSFTMDIRPNNVVFGAVYRLANVPRVHSAHMVEIFDGLEGFLGGRDSLASRM